MRNGWWLGVLWMVAGCELMGPRLAGEWDIEVVDADRCDLEMELEQSKGEVDGDGEVDCRVYFDGGAYYWDIQSDDVDVEGELDGDEFELTISFWDPVFEMDMESTLEGTVDGDEMTGDIYIEGEWFGEFEGDR